MSALVSTGGGHGHKPGCTCPYCTSAAVTAEVEVDLFDAWADIPMHVDETTPVAPEPAVEPEPAPAPVLTVVPEPVVEPEPEPEPETVLPEIGTDSGLTNRYGDPIIVTRFNAHLIGTVTQDDIDNRTEAFHDFRRGEEEAWENRISVEDVTLPENPTAEDIRRVATAVDDAFSTFSASTSGGGVYRGGVHDALYQVYGTPDRALVAIGNAVASRADELAAGQALGGAGMTERAWLERKENADARHEASGSPFKAADHLDIEYARDPQTVRALGDMAKAYQAALGEIRPMGGSLDLHEESSKPGAGVVGATADVWPAGWIQASNDCPNRLHIGKSIRRAHYSHDTTAEFTRRGQGEAVIKDITDAGRFTEVEYGPGDPRLQRNVDLDEFGVPKPRSTWYKGDRVSTYTTYEPLTEAEKAEHGFSASDNSYRVHEWEYRDKEQADKEYGQYLVKVLARTGIQVDTSGMSTSEATEALRQRAKYSGVKVQKHPLDGGELVTDPRFNRGEPFYRKPKTRENTTGKEQVSQIKLSADRLARDPRQDARFGPAVHEVGHRMEYLVPHLSAMTHTWRQRRVSESPTEEGRELRSIYRGTKEQGYTDEFIEHYIGKSYDERRESPFYRHPTGADRDFRGATEVFSMGADSIMAGRHGGLIGLSAKHKPDPDMRAFILGVFATAGLSKEQTR